MFRPEISVSLNRQSESYKPGEIVEGKVGVFSPNPVQIAGLQVALQGYANIEWKEIVARYSGQEKKRRVTYDVVTRNHIETYYQINTDLVPRPVNASIEWMPSLNQGRNEYQFSFTLPLTIPASYLHEFGFVVHEIVVTLKQYHYGNNNGQFEFRKKLWVNGHLSLKNEPTASHPMVKNKEITMCCLCCRTAPVGMTVNLEKRGFFLGEYVKFSVSIINNTSCKVFYRAALIEVSEFRAPQKLNVNSYWRTLAVVNGPLTRNQNRKIIPIQNVWEQNKVRVPLNIAPTGLGGYCTVIDITYKIVVTIGVCGRGMISDSPITLPIIIGTEP